MGTRSIIKVENFTTAALYKHWDGNPESTKPWLEEFNKAFVEERGKDPQYKFAQLIRSSTRNAEEFNLDNSLYTGWGVVEHAADVGQAYEYTLMDSGDVKVKSTY